MPARSPDTPWRRVYAKFGLNQSALAKVMGMDRSKISRALRDTKGLISGRDQEIIIRIAKDQQVAIKPDDMVPDIVP